LAFVHSTTIGNAAVIEGAQVEFQRGTRTVDVRREIKDALPPPTYQKAGQFPGNVDRWQYINFAPPGFVRLDTGACEAGKADDPKARRISLRNLNIITPEDENNSHYFWAQCHDFDVENSQTTEMIFEDVKLAFLEDVKVFEAQHVSILKAPQSCEIDVNGDTGGLQARRIIKRMLELQSSGKGS
jgi:vanillate O-demethylase monooxygenase subunit